MITRHDNNDGTTTFRGVDVTIPTSAARDYDVAAVRRARVGETVFTRQGFDEIQQETETLWIIATTHPTWKPPSNLPAGEYSWGSCGLANVLEECESWMFPQETASRFYRDWTDPAKYGKWRVNEDGTATYLGEA